MPIVQLQYQVLLSSPSDLAEERRAAREIVDELNVSWGKSVGASVHLIAWEDFVPGFACEPQSVINSQIGDSWDIYLGLMHTRFGTPTSHFGSGTEEEFSSAYDLWQECQDQRHVLLYFKTGSVDINTIDPDQLIRVRAFQKKIGCLGGLYKELQDTTAFRNILRAHLSCVLTGLHERQKSKLVALPTSVVSAQQLPSKLSDADLPAGFFDLAETAQTGVESLAPIINSFGITVSEMTNVFEVQTRVIGEASANGNLQAMRQCVSTISSSMQKTAQELAEKRRQYGAVSRPAFEALSTAISFSKTTWPDRIDGMAGLPTAITDAMRMMESYIESMHYAEQSMDSIPNISREFSTARLLLKRELSNLRSEIHASVALLRELKVIAE